MAGSAPASRYVLTQAARRATLAPSVHNTQPWRFVFRDERLELWADRSRLLSVSDPAGRQLTISCGCALFNARVAIAAAGYGARVEMLPDAGRPDLLARIAVAPRWGVRGELLAALDGAIDERRTNRRAFATESVPADLVDWLVRSAALEGARLLTITDAEQRREVTALHRYAAAVEAADAGYQAELREWTTDDPRRLDGVQAMSAPLVDCGTASGEYADDLPIRAFDTHARGWLPAHPDAGHSPCLLVLGTGTDVAWSWLAAGQALERVLLEITRAGYAASLFTQVIEVPSARDELRRRLDRTFWPHVIVRAGHAPAVPPTLRRSAYPAIT